MIYIASVVIAPWLGSVTPCLAKCVHVQSHSANCNLWTNLFVSLTCIRFYKLMCVAVCRLVGRVRVLCTATHVPDIGMHSIVIKSHII